MKLHLQLYSLLRHKALYAYNIKQRPKYNKNLFKIDLVKNWVATDKTKHGDL